MKNPEELLTQNAHKHYFFRVTPISKALALVLFVTLPFIGFFLGLNYSDQSSVPALKGAQEELQTPSMLDSESEATTTATGYIVSIDKDKVVVDYVDILYDKKALEALIADGYCAKGATQEECFPSVPIYDRNVNPTLRTFKMSPDVSILSDRGMETTVDKVLLAFKVPPSKFSVDKFPDRYFGYLYEITLNSKNEVSKIEGIFRP
ncbi:MAG: hypothetical protein V4437_00460 [Patescibacteria group bacterium]